MPRVNTKDWQPEYDDLWPKPEDEWLLRAALSSQPDFAEHFLMWRNEAGYANYDEIDYTTCRILPMVLKQFLRAGRDDPWLPKMKALHRYHWVTTKSKQKHLVKLIDAFDQAGIPTLVLKGNALIAGKYFDDAGERPLHDLDVLIRPDDEPAAAERLRSMNWTDLGDGPHAEFHARVWQAEDGVQLDLHRKLLPPPYAYIGLDALLPSSRKECLSGMEVRVPDATHLLMHCVVHGRLCWGSVKHPFLWVADAMRILQRSPDEIDWKRLKSDAQRFSILFDVRESLGYLRSRFDAPIPSDWLNELTEIPISRKEMLPFFRWTNGHEIHSLLELKDFMYADFLCHQQMHNQTPTTPRFIRYACQRFHRLATSDAGRRRIGFLGTKLRYEGLLASIRRPDYFQSAIDS